jgi:DNA-binding XRE family transcriptional regulator
MLLTLRIILVKLNKLNIFTASTSDLVSKDIEIAFLKMTTIIYILNLCLVLKTFMNSLSTIGAQIKTARKIAGLSQEELALRCSISRTTLIKLESGNGNVELNTLLAICEHLQLEVQLVASRIASIPRDLTHTTESPLQSLLNRRLRGKK